MTETQAAAGQVAAPRPPFAFRLEAPDDWIVFDTAPESWKRAAERLIDNRVGGNRLTSRERREALEILTDIVAIAQQAGVFITLVKAAGDADGRLFLGSLTLRWYDSAPIEPDLAFLDIVVGDNEKRRELETPLGSAVVVRSETEAVDFPDLFPEGKSYETQAYVPVPGSTWTAMFTGSTFTPAFADLTEKLVCRMAGSLQVELPEPAEPSGDEPSGSQSAGDGQPGGGTAAGPPARGEPTTSEEVTASDEAIRPDDSPPSGGLATPDEATTHREPAAAEPSGRAEESYPGLRSGFGPKKRRGPDGAS